MDSILIDDSFDEEGFGKTDSQTMRGKAKVSEVTKNKDLPGYDALNSLKAMTRRLINRSHTERKK